MTRSTRVAPASRCAPGGWALSSNSQYTQCKDLDIVPCSQQEEHKPGRERVEVGVAALLIPPNDLLRDIVLPLLTSLGAAGPEGACFAGGHNKGPREPEALTTA